MDPDSSIATVRSIAAKGAPAARAAVSACTAAAPVTAAVAVPDVATHAPASSVVVREPIRLVPAPPYEPAAGPASSSEAASTVPASTAPASTAGPASTRQSERTRRAPASAASARARRAAIAMVTALFEVVDRRRPAAHLGAVVSARLLEHVELLVSADLPRTDSDGPGECAQVRRVHIQMRGAAAAEVFGSYSRGRRVRAFAGRIELLLCRVRAADAPARSVPARLEYRWRLVAFTLT